MDAIGNTSPLHPLFIHLPIALTLLLPPIALFALWRIRRGGEIRTRWGVAVGTIALLVGSAWLAVQTGERDAERVEDVVREAPIEQHEEAAEAFLATAGLVLVVAAAGLLHGRAGMIARGVATIGTLGLVVGGWQVGRSGGELAYREGAALAYARQGDVGIAAEGSARSSLPGSSRQDDDEGGRPNERP